MITYTFSNALVQRLRDKRPPNGRFPKVDENFLAVLTSPCVWGILEMEDLVRFADFNGAGGFVQPACLN
jgi:hypothetical protein